MTPGVTYRSLNMADLQGVYRTDDCGCMYDDYFGEQIRCCDSCLQAKRRRTVRILVKRRHDITTNARRIAAMRSAYANTVSGSLLNHTYTLSQ